MKKTLVFYLSLLAYIILAPKSYGLKSIDTPDAILKKTVLVSAKEYLVYNQSNSNKVNFDSTKKIRILFANNNYVEEATIFYKQYSIVVKSYYVKDSVDRSGSNLFNPVCIKQTIYFYKEHQLIRTLYSSAKKIIQKISSGKKMMMLENVIVSIGLIKCKNGIFVVIEGSGGPECDSCSFFEGIYNLTGGALAVNYATKYKLYFNYRSIYGVIKSLRIDKTEFEQMRYSHIKIYSYLWFLG